MLSPDIWPYGLAANRHGLETLQGYMREQGLIARAFPLEEAFATGTLDHYRN